MTDILTVIDQLTQPRVEHVVQRTDEGKWMRVVSIEQPSLLQLLADAGSGRTSAGSNAGKHERAPIDLEAAYLHAQYTTQVGDWCRMVGARPTRDVTQDLRAWYAATLPIVNFDTTGYQAILNNWVHTITTHFDPPRRFEADHPCPVCGATTYGDQITGGGKAIEVSYRVDEETGTPTGERALCRPCGTVWQGGDAVRELAEEMHEKHAV